MDAAHVRGDLDKRWKELLALDACEEHARAVNAKLDFDVVESLCNEFRYARDIVTAEETERWLSDHLIFPEELQAHFERGFWLSQFEDQMEPEPTNLSAASPEQWNTFRIYLTLSGELENLSRKLSQRIAVAHHALAGRAGLAEAVQFERERFLNREEIGAHQLTQWIESRGRTLDWLDLQFEFEALFKLGCGETLTAENQKRALSGLSLALIQFEYEILEVDSPEVLKEAHLSITVDEIPTEQLAREYGFPYRKMHSFLEFLPPPLQQPFLSAGVGDVILSGEKRHRLFRITKKSEPTIDDPAVQRHLHRRLLGTLLSGLEAQHVEWLLQPGNRS